MMIFKLVGGSDFFIQNIDKLVVGYFDICKKYFSILLV